MSALVLLAEQSAPYVRWWLAIFVLATVAALVDCVLLRWPRHTAKGRMDLFLMRARQEEHRRHQEQKRRAR
jgi:hypothetical protein